MTHYRYLDVFERRSWALCAKKGQADSLTSIEIFVDCPQCLDALYEWDFRSGWKFIHGEAHIVLSWSWGPFNKDLRYTYLDLNGQYLGVWRMLSTFVTGRHE